jgi:hypothetical protein
MLATGKPTLRTGLGQRTDRNTKVTTRFSDSGHAFTGSTALRLLALRFLSVEMKEVARLTHKNSQLMRTNKIGKGLLGFWKGYS